MGLHSTARSVLNEHEVRALHAGLHATGLSREGSEIDKN